MTMSGSNRAIYPEDATSQEAEEMSRQVRDLVGYLAKYDDPEFVERLGKIENPSAILILIQSGQRKFERGLSVNTALIAVGAFNPLTVSITIREWLTESVKGAMLGKEIV